jgi:chromate reductase, NAD(P)H dehydrogenase (quinone)
MLSNKEVLVFMITVNKKNILAISGSTRKNSTNYYLIKAIEALTKDIFEITIFESIAGLPHFNPDCSTEKIPKEIIAFRKLILNADAVIICTPEYAHGVPGTLKNAIDWTVSTNEFYQKPTALITASTDGKYAHGALLEILNAIEAKNVNNHQLIIQFAKTKVNADNTITDEGTLNDVLKLIKSVQQTLLHEVEIKK